MSANNKKNLEPFWKNAKFEEASVILKKITDGEPVNKNPLTEMPTPEMRLYGINNNYFLSIDELLIYCRKNRKTTKDLEILDYYRHLAGRSDVIMKSNSSTSLLYAACDEDGYGTYNKERSIYRGEFVWEYNNGSISNLYKVFRDNGVVFENDIYARIDERRQKILKMIQK